MPGGGQAPGTQGHPGKLPGHKLWAARGHGVVSSTSHRLPGSQLVSHDLRPLGTYALQGYYTHRAIEFPSFDPSLLCISYLRLLLPLTLSPRASQFLLLGGLLSLDVPSHGCIYSCWGCFDEDQTRWVFPELKVLGVLCIRGQTPGIERYPTSLAAGH